MAAESPHAGAPDEEILAQVGARGGRRRALGINREAVLVSNVPAEGAIARRLFLASIGQADLALEGHFLAPLFRGAPSGGEQEVGSGGAARPVLGVGLVGKGCLHPAS